ncbi:MAG: zinc ribbon domain-containing protein [Eubacteriales bacterium]
MFCNKCGNQLEGNSKFCDKCGASVNAPQAPVPPVALQQPTDQTAPIKQRGIIGNIKEIVTDIWQDTRKRKIAFLLLVGIVIAMSFRDRFFFGDKEGGVTNQGMGLEALLVKATRYGIDGSISGWSEREYDSNGNEVKGTSYNGDGSISYWNEREYDSNGNKVKDIAYSGDGSVSSWEEYGYDSNGNKVKYISYNGDGQLEYFNEYLKVYEYYEAGSSIYSWEEYEYDSNGNQVKSIVYNEDGSISSWGEYEYVYQ